MLTPRFSPGVSSLNPPQRPLVTVEVIVELLVGVAGRGGFC
jgi:hypothetical protein